MLLPMLFNSLNPLLEERQIGELLKSNEKTMERGLALTSEEAKNILVVRNNVLRSCGRVELGIEVTKGLIENFYNSSFILKENYVETLNELQEVFYYIKNETEDKIGDLKLIGIIKDYFENSCGGSIDFLKSTLESFAADFRRQTQKEEALERGD